MATQESPSTAMMTTVFAACTAVADTARRFPLPVGAFGELVDGVQMDLTGTRYDTFDELVG